MDDIVQPGHIPPEMGEGRGPRRGPRRGSTATTVRHVGAEIFPLVSPRKHPTSTTTVPIPRNPSSPRLGSRLPHLERVTEVASQSTWGKAGRSSHGFSGSRITRETPASSPLLVTASDLKTSRTGCHRGCLLTGEWVYTHKFVILSEQMSYPIAAASTFGTSTSVRLFGARILSFYYILAAFNVSGMLRKLESCLAVLA